MPTEYEKKEELSKKSYSRCFYRQHLKKLIEYAHMKRLFSMPYLRADLALIFGLLFCIGVVIGILWYADSSSGIFGEWAREFYAILMRR